jgi:nitroreductase
VSHDHSATTRVPLHPLLADRWSSRAFSDQPVTPEIVVSLMEAVRWAPSAFNDQPWRFILATRDNLDSHARLLTCINTSNQRWAPHAWVLLLTLANSTFEADGSPNRTAQYDLGQSIQNLTVQASAHGLNVRQMAGILPDKIREMYHIPEDVTVMTAVAVGYPGDAARLPAPLPERETHARTRKPLQDLFFGDEFGQSHPLTKPE